MLARVHVPSPQAEVQLSEKAESTQSGASEAVVDGAPVVDGVLVVVAAVEAVVVGSPVLVPTA